MLSLAVIHAQRVLIRLLLLLLSLVVFSSKELHELVEHATWVISHVLQLVIASLLLWAIGKQRCILLLRNRLLLFFLNLVVILVWGDLWHFAYSLWIEFPENLLVYPLVLILSFVDVRLKHLSSIDDSRVVWVVRTIWIVHIWLATSSRAYLAWASIAYPHTLTDLRRRSSRCFLWPTNAYTGSLYLDLPLWLLRAVK